MIMRNFRNTNLKTNMSFIKNIFGVNKRLQGGSMQNRKVWADFVYKEFSLMVFQLG